MGSLVYILIWLCTPGGLRVVMCVLKLLISSLKSNFSLYVCVSTTFSVRYIACPYAVCELFLHFNFSNVLRLKIVIRSERKVTPTTKSRR